MIPQELFLLYEYLQAVLRRVTSDGFISELQRAHDLKAQRANAFMQQQHQQQISVALANSASAAQPVTEAPRLGGDGSSASGASKSGGSKKDKKVLLMKFG